MYGSFARENGSSKGASNMFNFQLTHQVKNIKIRTQVCLLLAFYMVHPVAVSYTNGFSKYNSKAKPGQREDLLLKAFSWHFMFAMCFLIVLLLILIL